ncbi:G8 domain protein [Rubripirellula obstinata]|uniref:G8 domain protein n=1 Tax=Rubripirellula obstinata TaxID=406547 RepID=A0A5B1CH35_9BACT|nr:G8 domain-containing protein [Rubripirellula obstinata]KAA1259866.1 G8 domain protein [Rubripirellula obstinata]
MGRFRSRFFKNLHNDVIGGVASRSGRLKSKDRQKRRLKLESLESRRLLTATLAVSSGDWSDASTWSNGVPNNSTRAIIGQGKAVTLDSTNHIAREVVVHGQLIAEEGPVGSADKSLTTRWMHVNSGGVFQIGTPTNRYDNHDFVLTLTGTNPNADFTVETAMGTMQVMDNDGFLMTGGGGSLQFYGDEKLSFTKLARTAWKNSTSIRVENVIERNFDGTTSAASDGSLVGSQAWEVGDQIVIASSSYDYTEQDVRTITGVSVQGSETVLTLNSPTSHRHYGNIEYYKDGELSIDLRAEVALLNRSIIVQGTQDTDSNFGNRARYGTTSGRNLGVGAHAMFMPGSGTITIDSVQFDKMGQTGILGRYPVHWHLGGNRTGDVMVNSSVTNSNNRGVTIHGTQGLVIEGNVLHDIHGHGMFMEDAAEFNNQFLSNIVLGIHKVGGARRNDPFIVPGITRGSNGQVNGEAPRNGTGEGSHDTGQQIDKRFLSSAAYWITNPNNTWVGNISAGSEGTGFWFILPDRVIGLSRDTGLYNGIDAGETNLGVFDNNTSHSSPIGLTFDRGADIRGGGSVGYNPPQVAVFNDFTGYKHDGTAVYHRGGNAIFDGSKFADVANGSFNTFSQEEHNILFVGHSQGNADLSHAVGGYRLYDGPGRIIGAHFAGFAADNAYTFLNNGGTDKYAMTRAEGITYEDDGTADNLQVYFLDNSGIANSSPANAAGRPDAISGIVLDVDGSLTGHAGGGVDHVLTPRIDFYRDSTDIAPPGWNAYISDDRFGYLELDTVTGSGNFPYFDIENGDGNRLRVNRRNISSQRLYTKLNAGDYTITFIDPVPSDGFSLRMDVRRGQKPGDYTVYRFKGIGEDYKPTSGIDSVSLQAMRDATSNAYFRDGAGDLWMKVFESGRRIQIRPTDDPLPTNLEIDELWLVDADSNEDFDIDVAPLTDNMVINLTALGIEGVNVRATTNIAAGSIGFALSGPLSHNQTESIAPYALFGDQQGDFNAEVLPVGQYTLIVTPYPSPGLNGTPGTPVTVNFEITQPVQLPFLDQTVQDGTIIKAEEFDYGGQQIAYFDTTAGNSGSGNNARPDEDVDLNSSSILVSQIIDGEWLEFTRDVVPGVYDIDVNVNQFSVQNPPKGIRVLIAENAFSTSFTELGSVEIPDPDVTGTNYVIEGVDLTSWAGPGRVFRTEFYAPAPDIVIAPASATLQVENGSYMDSPYGANGENWFNGSGLTDPAGSTDASDVETGDPVPLTWPQHQTGNDRNRVSRIRNAVEENTLTIDLDGTYDLSGMVLWNSTEGGQTDRGFENTVLSYSTDGGTNFSGSDSLTWTQLASTGGYFPPEINMLDGVREGVTHVRMVVDNFSPSGSDNIVMASELRFIGKGTAAAGANLALNFDSLQFTNAQDMDFGDAPQSYGTLLTDDGARHAAVGPQLGANRDTENDGIATPDADGDGSDDDGVMFGAINVGGTMAGVNIKLPTDTEGQIDAWIDFNRNGSFDAGEKIINDLSVNELEQTINYMIPTDIPGGITVGDTYARVRISSDGGLEPTGFAADGEVEDYVVSIIEPPQVESIVVNEGHSQRSSLDSVRITFDTVVDINQVDGNPFEITRAGSGGTLMPMVSIDDTSGKTVVDLTFADSETFVTDFGSLVDGDYQLRIDATLVTDRWVQLDGNRDGSAGDDYVMSATDGLFRMYGDADGSKSVGLTDFAAFRSVFGTSSSDANALSGLNSDADDTIGLTDFAAFRANFGK